METDFSNVAQVGARMAVFELTLVSIMRALSKQHPATARAIARGLQDHRARLVQESPEALETHAQLLQWQQMIDDLLAHKPQ
jgi:hypothetical protein